MIFTILKNETEPAHQENMTIISLYEPNNRAPKIHEAKTVRIEEIIRKI